MRKMEKPELELILLAGGDVIATSECLSNTGMPDGPPPVYCSSVFSCDPVESDGPPMNGCNPDCGVDISDGPPVHYCEEDLACRVF